MERISDPIQFNLNKEMQNRDNQKKLRNIFWAFHNFMSKRTKMHNLILLNSHKRKQRTESRTIQQTYFAHSTNSRLNKIKCTRDYLDYSFCSFIFIIICQRNKRRFEIIGLTQRYPVKAVDPAGTTNPQYVPFSQLHPDPWLKPLLRNPCAMHCNQKPQLTQ